MRPELPIAVSFVALALSVPGYAMPANFGGATRFGTDTSQQCSADALPADRRRAMRAEYNERLRTDGKASADAWAGEQARRFRQQLVAEGVCPSTDRRDEKATVSPNRDPKLRGKDGRPCKTTRLEHRNIANLGGGAMNMVLVPVCAD